ncbi:MAG: transporter [Pseudomonadota bacterium]
MVHTAAPEKHARARWMQVIFTATIFLSAALLFFVQPLFAKLVLPIIGGSPAVWATAMLFFQTVLLLGYLYAHFSSQYLTPQKQVMVHIAIWGAALTFLPPAIPPGWQLDPTSAIAWQTLGLFAIGVGVPFALLSSNAPLIQAWYARSGGYSADDPYFLYGASNIGSLLALMAFPLIAEPLFGAGDISRGFAIGFFVLGIGLLACGLNGLSPGETKRTERRATPAPRLETRAYWLFLAFIPSSLMLAVTSKITTDIGAVPLIWVIPLALYLLSFVLAFRSTTLFTGLWFTQCCQLIAVAGICLFAGVAGDHLSTIAMGFLIFCFFALAIWAHRGLYETRPSAEHLTTFYATMSVGGALGGLFNSILAPYLFSDLIEGTVTMSLALIALFRGVLGLTRESLLRGGALGLAIGGTLTGVAASFEAGTLALVALMVLGIALVALSRPGVPVFTVAAGLAVALPAWLASPDDRLFADRSFFGLHQILEEDGVRLYSNGTTLHGAQRLADMAARRPVPTTYYHPAGPMGQVLQSNIGQNAGSIGIVGLGVGSLACYAARDQDWHFYEIDEMVDRVARTPELFTFLSACTPTAPTHLGDARIVLEQQSNIGFDLLVIDAYSSDSVPVHLTTLEAMDLYLQRLNPGGVLTFHISNRYYDIGLPLARSAEALGVSAWRQNQAHPASDDPGYRMSDVMIIAADPKDVARVLTSGLWTEVQSDGGPIWTDDRANPLSILKPGALGQ